MQRAKRGRQKETERGEGGGDKKTFTAAAVNLLTLTCFFSPKRVSTVYKGTRPREMLTSLFPHT